MISSEYKIEIQARIPTALPALHNYIRAHVPHEGPLPHTAAVNDSPVHQLGHAGGDRPGASDSDIAGPSDAVEGSACRDRIATQMWDDYQNFLHEPDLLDIDQFVGIDEEEASDEEAAQYTTMKMTTTVCRHHSSTQCPPIRSQNSRRHCQLVHVY